MIDEKLKAYLEKQEQKQAQKEQETLSRNEFLDIVKNAQNSGDFEGKSYDDVYNEMFTSVYNDGAKIEGVDMEKEMLSVRNWKSPQVEVSEGIEEKELEGKEKKEDKSFLDNVGDGLENFRKGQNNAIKTAGASIPKIIGNTLGFVSDVADKIVPDQVQDFLGIDYSESADIVRNSGGQATDYIKDKIGVERGTISEGIGDFGAEIATVVMGDKGLSKLSKAPKALAWVKNTFAKAPSMVKSALGVGNKVVNNKITRGALQGTKDMAIYDVVTKGEIKKNDLVLGGAIGGSIPLIGKGLSKTKNALFPKYSLDDLVGKVAQGKTTDIPAVKQALSQIDTKGVKTYKDLNKLVGEKISTLANKQDEILGASKLEFKLDDLITTSKGGTIQKNFVAKAIDDVKVVADELGDINLSEFIQKFSNKSTINVKDLNELSRLYNTSFGKKIYSATGNQKVGNIAGSYENTRRALKDMVESKLGDNTTRLLDKEMSNLYKTQGLMEKMIENVNTIQQKFNERGLGYKLTQKGLDVIDKLSLGSLKGFKEYMFIGRNQGEKILNNMDLQNALSKNLKQIDKLLKQERLMSDEYFLKQFKEIVGVGNKVKKGFEKSTNTIIIKGDKLSEILKNSLKNNKSGVKINRLDGKQYSIKEAETLLTNKGSKSKTRIVIGLNDSGELVLVDGRHLLEAYSRLNKNIPMEVLGFTSNNVKKILIQKIGE